jgi:hypothetical protein
MRIASATSVSSVIAFAVLAFASGCREPVSVVSAHAQGKGTAAVYDASLDQTWAAVHAALRWDSAGTPEDHPNQGYIVTNHPGSDAPSANDQVGVWFEPMNAQKTRVSVVVMSGSESTAGVGGPDEKTVQKDIGKALAILQSGQALPEKRPQ